MWSVVLIKILKNQFIQFIKLYWINNPHIWLIEPQSSAWFDHNAYVSRSSLEGKIFSDLMHQISWLVLGVTFAAICWSCFFVFLSFSHNPFTAMKISSCPVLSPMVEWSFVPPSTPVNSRSANISSTWWCGTRGEPDASLHIILQTPSLWAMSKTNGSMLDLVCLLSASDVRIWK